MSRSTLHGMTPRSGAHGRRIVILLMIVATGALLAAPATAGAHVATKHKKEYKANLEAHGKAMMLHKDAYDRTQVDAQNAADRIGPLLGSQDPVDQENLNGLQLDEGVNARTWAYLWPRLKASFDEGIDDFCRKALPWFRTKAAKADKQDLRDGTAGIKRAFDKLFKDGFGGIAMEQQTLSEAVKLDDLVTFYQQHEDATKARGQAETRFNRAIAILNDLQ
jgi:hypothetical protein